MARDDEPLQPESPLQGDAVQLDNEETLEGDPRADPLDSGYVPPDRPVAMDAYGTTLGEELAGESLDQRLAREEPDVLDAADVGDEAAEVTEVTEVTEMGDLGEPDPRSGRLLAEDEGAHVDEETDLVAHDVGIDGGAASAEEAAVHERYEAEGEVPDE